MLTLNVESDELLYRACFATEKQAYKLISSKGKVLDFGPKYTKTEIKKKILEVGATNCELVGYKIVEPVSHPIFLLKRFLNKLKALGEPVLWLSPSNGSNFRFKVAKTPGQKGVGYKACRPPKPAHYQAVRDYLIKYCGAQEIEGYEADDALSMYQSNNSVAVHIDKDINMVEGKHLHWVSGGRYRATYLGNLPTKDSRGTGKSFFFHQMLTGDITDNIPGIPNIGPIKASKALEKCTTEKDMLEVIKEMYYNTYKDEYKSVMYEIADLLYMVDSYKRTGSVYLRSLE